ncbi:hypothetical protein SAMN05421747_11914 [Parapedobacter composti]|uniref:Uncharacterized protein n=1 Tax=Parapedobacter composti TaxID=623281 RepID=A0A1I1LD57_9SPHI|nr:hypothetical protein [Parapedobacter composti]SFC68323.1 hypothetical protein SAMN05421747_11914 [Parapedobacter composti]
MTQQKVRSDIRTPDTSWVDGKEELKTAHRLLVGLRYHVQAQYLLSYRKSKQRIVIWIAAITAVLTVALAVTR